MPQAEVAEQATLRSQTIDLVAKQRFPQLESEEGVADKGQMQERAIGKARLNSICSGS